MQRPLVIVAILYAGGLLLAELIAPPLPWLLAAGLGMTALAVGWERGRRWLLPVAIVLTGWANLVAHTQIISPHDLRLTFGSAPEDIVIRGQLAEAPSVRMFIRDEEESFRTLVTLDVTEIRRLGKWLPASGRLMTVTPGDLEGVVYAGTAVEVRGIVATPPLPTAPGLFDYRSYLARQGIWYQLRASSTNDWRALGEVQPPLSTKFIHWAQITLARGLPETDESLRLLYSMTLGWRTGLTNEVFVPFMQTGTMHIFAISGLHIVLIAGLLVALLRSLRLSRQFCGLLVIPLIWFYTGATGWQSSAIRSTLMMSVVIGGWSLHRPYDLLNSLAAAGLMILVWQPQQLFQASFQLSFFVVLSIALLNPPLQRFTDRQLAHDPLLPREALPRWRRWLEPPARWLTLSFTTSLAAWLGALPLTLYYFHLFSPITLLANLVIVPMSSAALASNLGSLVCGGWLPWAGELFNHSAWFWMRGMVGLSEWAARVPGAFWYAAAPTTADFIIYYGLLLLVLSRVLFQPGRRRWLAAIVASVLAFYGWQWLDTRQEIRLTVLPLQGGSAVFIHDRTEGTRLLVDCGNTNAVEFTTAPYLRGQGVNHLPQLLLTHGDLRQVGGAERVLEDFTVAELLTSPARFRSRAYREITEAAEQRRLVREVAASNHIGGWQVLHPLATDKFPQADDNAVVLRGEFNGTRILLVSDLGMLGQDALASREPDLRADIVITGLPDKSAALTEHFLDAVRPKLVIVADSEFPATRRAPASLLSRLESADAEFATTRINGAVEIRLRPRSWTARGMDGRTWQNASPVTDGED